MIENELVMEIVLDSMSTVVEGTLGEFMEEMEQKMIAEDYASDAMPLEAKLGMGMLTKIVALASILSREGAVCSDYEFTDELMKLMKENSELEPFAGELTAKFREVYSADGELIHRSVSVKGPKDHTKADPEPDEELLDEIILPAIKKMKGVWPKKVLKRALKFGEGKVASMVDKSFRGTVDRVSDRTEAEVEQFRSEIDDLFQTWEGGT